MYDKSFIQSGNSPAPNATSTTAPRAAITFPVGRFISGMPVTHRIIWIQLAVEGKCKLIEVKRVVASIAARARASPRRVWLAYAGISKCHVCPTTLFIRIAA